MAERNGKCVWMREIEKVLRRFDASLEWLIERMAQRDGEFDSVRQNGQTCEREKGLVLRAVKAMSISDVLEEVESSLTCTNSMLFFWKRKARCS